MSVCYNINDEGHKVVQDWLKSKDTWEANTPPAIKLWKILYTNINIQKFDQKFNIKKRFDDLSYLHNYIHSKGVRYSNKQGSMSNYQLFDEEILFKWLDAYENIVVLLITLHMLKYPITSIKFEWRDKVGIDNPFPVIELFQIDGIKEILPENYFDEIQTIASNDDTTQGLYKHILSLPDMTAMEKKRDK